MASTAGTRDGQGGTATGPAGPVAAEDSEGGEGGGDGGVLSRRYRALTFGIVSVVLLIAFEATAVGTAMPVAARDLHGLGLYAFAFSGYFTTSLLAMVVSGQWCDRSGPAAPLATGIAGFGAGLVVSGTARSMEPFVLGRAVQGLGGGLVIVALYVVVGRAYPERLRPAVMAAFSASWVVPSIVGPLVSGTVTQHLGWRWVFLAIPVLVLLPLGVMMPALRRATRAAATAADGPAGPGGVPRARAGADDRARAGGAEALPAAAPAAGERLHGPRARSGGARVPFGGARVRSGGVRAESGGAWARRRAAQARAGRGRARSGGARVPFGGVRAESGGAWARRRAAQARAGRGRARSGGVRVRSGGASGAQRIWLAAALAAGAALLEYAGQDLRPRSVLPAAAGAALLVPAALRLLPRGTFRAARGMPAVVLLRGIAAGSFVAAESFVPLMLVTQRHLSPTMAGLALSGGGLTWALGSYVQARPRLEPVRERLAQLGMVLTTAAIGSVPLALLHAVPPWIVAVAWCVGGMGMGMVISALSVLMLRLSPPAEAGTNSAALQVSDALSNVLIVAACGTVFSALGGGSVSAATGGATATAGHPAAFTAVFLPAAGIALLGTAVAARLRAKPSGG